METPYLPCSIPTDWKELYRAAILETNENLIPEKVSAAETAIRLRARELFGTYGTGEEKESLDDALYALHAFRTAVRNPETA
jgi:hypothetical protein